MTNIRTILAQNMKAGRKKLHISQAELAEKISSAPNYISKIEAEKQFPSVDMIEKIAGALAVDSVDLFSTEQQEQKQLDSIQDDLIKNINTLINEGFEQLKKKKS